MTIKNTKLWEALYALATSEGDVRKRVALACSILDKMQNDELPKALMDRLQKVKDEAGKDGPLRNADGEIIRNRYENTIAKRYNKTYSKLAKEILSVYEDFNNS